MSADSDVRSAVATAYGNRVRPVLDAVEMLTIIPTDGAACCDTSADACCDTDSVEAVDRIAALYAGTDLGDMPDSVTSVAFGCGNPTAIDAMKPGEAVLDLGSGGGIDCFLAGRMVGPSGRVIGVDMTPEMVALANRNLEKVGASNVEFRLGEIESLPVDSASIDVIISNCVINLSPNKPAVFAEALRVLRPGGRLQVSDMVWLTEPPAAERESMESWSGCVAGALLASDFVAGLEQAGFANISLTSASDATEGLVSADITAYRPA